MSMVIHSMFCSVEWEAIYEKNDDWPVAQVGWNQGENHTEGGVCMCEREREMLFTWFNGFITKIDLITVNREEEVKRLAHIASAL